MAKRDDQSPATKKDIALLMERIGELYDANQRWKDEILEASQRWKDEILEANRSWKDEMIHEFHIVAEDIRHDVGGAQKDRISGIEIRVARLEQHTGIAA